MGPRPQISCATAQSIYSERSVVRDALDQRPAALEDARLACRNGLAFACRLVEELSPAK
jgi:hypothetical protein